MTAVEEVVEKVLASGGLHERIWSVVNEHQEEQQRHNHELRNFIQTHSLETQTGLKRLEGTVEKLAATIEAAQRLEDERAKNQDHVADQVRAINLSLQQTQAATTNNTQSISLMRDEMSDIYHRLIPVTTEVFGDKETGKPSLRQEMDRRHNEVLQELRTAASGIDRMLTRQTELETQYALDMHAQRETLAKIAERHRQEDLWLKERPRQIKNALVSAGASLIASSLVKWGAVLLGGTGIGAVVYEFLRQLIGV